MATSVELFHQQERGKQVATGTERIGGIRVERVEDLATVCEAAFNSGDLEGVAGLYEAGAVLVEAPGQATEGLDAIRESLARFLATKAIVRITTSSIEQVGGLALSSYEWTLDATDADGNPATMGGPGAAVHRRQPDGRWLVVIDNPFAFAGVMGS
ncbi:MAG: YybH family protein [Actinomycetota bacterium]